MLTYRKEDFQYFHVNDYKNIKDYYDTEIKINSRTVSLDLNFESNSTSATEMERVNLFVDWISELNEKNKSYLLEDIKKMPSMSRDYLNFFLEELDDFELSKIIGLTDSSQSRILKLLKKLNIIRVGIYPHGDCFATFDYSIDLDGEPCNQLLVINLNQDGTLDYITWES